jgi:hypothetical protein
MSYVRCDSCEQMRPSEHTHSYSDECIHYICDGCHLSAQLNENEIITGCIVCNNISQKDIIDYLMMRINKGRHNKLTLNDIRMRIKKE